MKRLLDESTDELTRSLLEAGVEHRPPAGNKRQLIVAMGAGGALGLFSSNAFAWLGTTAGKVTAGVTAVGVAGAVFVAGPLLRPSEPSHAPQQTVNAARPSPEQAAQVADTRVAELGQEAVAERAGAEEALAEPASDGDRDVLREATAPGAASEAVTPEAVTPDEVAAPERRATGKSASQKKAQSKKASGRKTRASASLSKKKNASKKRVDVVASTAGEAAAQAATGKPPVVDARRAALDAEVRLVDDMHGAARRNDREALARLVAAYRSEFPDGQLKKEVADFEAKLAQHESP